MYSNYKKFSVDFNEKDHCFACLYHGDHEETEWAFVSNARVSFRNAAGAVVLPSSFAKVNYSRQGSGIACQQINVYYEGGNDGVVNANLQFILTDDAIEIKTFSRGVVHIDGDFHWGDAPGQSTFGIRLQSHDNILRAASGPAFSRHDNALFDRQHDRVLEFRAPDRFRVAFDWAKNAYGFTFENGVDFGRNFSFRIHEHYCRDKFAIPYAPIRKTHGFITPPVGWMTWYAVQFKACEEVVLDNARKLRERFGDHADKLCLWVDWEWNHKAFDGLGEEGVNTFTPRKEPYPNGLAVVAKQISDMGLIPILWVGATNDGQINPTLKEHPDWVIGQKPSWCGQYWVDPTNPEVVKSYIPAIFKQIMDWGFKAIKWDCLPVTFDMCELFHDKLKRPDVPLHVAIRQVIQAARDTVGPDVYMLSCAGSTERDITFAMDIFDAARIGGDIFGWEEFIRNSIERVFRFFAWHNVVFYADGDNLVLRKEFNNLNQARSRVSFYGLTGLPLTIGDPMDDLDEARVDMLRRIMPVVDVHPMELAQKTRGKDCVVTNLLINKPFGFWNVVAVMNLKEEPLSVSLSLAADLDIDNNDGQRYAAYDFWQDRYLGVVDDTLQLDIAAQDSVVLRLTPLADDRPTVVSSSRHITQGGYELADLCWDEKSLTLSGVSQCVANEPCRISIALPDGLSAVAAEATNATAEMVCANDGAPLKVVLTAPQNAAVAWTLRCEKNG
jgi:hypothetical protein